MTASSDIDRYYVRQSSKVTSSQVWMVVRRNGIWYSRMLDSMGLSPIMSHRNAPPANGLKPYILTSDWNEVVPLVWEFRKAYIGRLMDSCGFQKPEDPWEPQNDFLEAVRTEDGGIAVSAAHKPRLDTRWRQEIVTVNAKTGENRTHWIYDDPGEGCAVPWRFKAELERIPKDEARDAIRTEAEGWWDSLVEECAKWEVAR